MPIKSIQARRTIRRYTDEKLTEEEIHKLLLSAMFAPSAWGKKSWEFIVVEDVDIKRELASLTPYSSQAASAPVVFVVVADKNLSNSWVEDASIAAEHINLEAVKLGMGSSWIQVRGMQHNTSDAEEHIRQQLGIPGTYGVCCMITVGHPAEQKSLHREGEYAGDKVHFNRFGFNQREAA